jgi:putative nucleotidyltransferase with HDIG domain
VTPLPGRPHHGRWPIVSLAAPPLDPAGPAVADGVAPGVVDALAALADLSTGAHPDHARTLARWAHAVGRELGLEGDELADVAIAARVHDLGQAGVPDRVLHKAAPLDDAEWEAVRRHSGIGADVLALMPGLESASLLVRHHHERWDGSGYPDGLAGEAIPLGSRIVAACEALGALLTDRPYRPAYARPTALAALQAGAGACFDPAVVAALLHADVPGEEPTPPSRADAQALATGPAPTATADGRPASQLVQAFARLERLPASTEARRRLVDLVARDGPLDVDEATAAISTDIALTVAVLGSANSELTPKKASAGVRDAVRALGAEGVRGVLEHFGAIGVFERVPGWESTLEQFRLHAVATQRAAEQVARALGDEPTDELSVAALLHDVGKLVLASAHAHYPSAVHPPDATPEARLMSERRVLGADHAVAGGVMGRRWRLPDGVVRAIEHHHDAEAAGDVAIVRLADMLAHHGHGRHIDTGALSAVAGALGLGAAGLESLLHELPEVGPQPRATPSPLSPRETSVLRSLAAGHAYARIAADLGVSLSTVRTQALTAGAKLGTKTRTQAVLAATAGGWL